MTDKEEGVSEEKLSAIIKAVDSKSEGEPKAKKARKPYEWTEKRAEAFQKMRDGLALKVEVAQQLKKEKKELEKKDIKERIAKIMNSAQKEEQSTKRRKGRKEPETSDSEQEMEKGSVSSDSEEEERQLILRKQRSKTPVKLTKHELKEQKREGDRSRSKRKEKERYIEESDSGSSESEEESFEIASAKQKQHYRDAKVNLGKVQKSTRTLNALDNYILLG
jgi:hypothetical protein